MALVIDPASAIGTAFSDAARRRRIVAFTGIPGMGKSLYLQQQALVATEAGRRIHLLQWDVTRAAFEPPGILARFPEVDGVTHPAIRKAVGLWARGAIARWHQTHPDPQDMLIAEIPVIGNRLSELVVPDADAAEPLLEGEDAVFFLTVPSVEVRQVIEAARARSIAAPAHEREARDAPPQVLRALWKTMLDLARDLGLSPATDAYDPQVYRAVFAHLLQFRHMQVLEADAVLPSAGSVYDLPGPLPELTATPEEVEAAFAEVARRFPGEACAEAVENWHRQFPPR